MPKYGKRKGLRKSYRGVRSRYRYKIRRNSAMGARASRALAPFRSRWKNPVSGSRFVKFRYIDTGFTGSTTALSPQTLYVFSGNSIYDPDATGVGIQPFYFDEIGNTVNRYQVYASKMTVYINTITPDAGGENTPIKVMIAPYHGTSVANTSPSEIMNLRGSQQMKFSSNYLDTEKRRKIVAYESNRKVFPGIAQDANFSATWNANPTLRWYWLIYFDTSIDSTHDFEIYFDVKIVYYTRISQTYSVSES